MKVKKVISNVLLIMVITAIMLTVIGMKNITKAATSISFNDSQNKEEEGFSWDAATKTLTITNINQKSTNVILPKKSTINIQGENENLIGNLYVGGDLTIKGNNKASLKICSYDLQTSTTAIGPYISESRYARAVVLNGGVLTMESGNFYVDTGCGVSMTGIYGIGVVVNGGNLNINVRGAKNATKAISVASRDIIINGGTLTACTGTYEKNGSSTGKAFNKTPIINYDCKISYSNEENLENAKITTDKSKVDYASVKIEGNYKLGDLDGSGEIDVADYMIVLAYIRGTKILTEEELKLADVNCDGEVDVSDYMQILNHVKGIKLLD